jgi:1A family penicillin-binding protein
MLNHHDPFKLPDPGPRLAEPGEDWRRPFVKGMLIVLLGAVLFLCLASALAAGAYAYVAGTLPSPEELRIRTDTFESTKIYDRNGVLLYEIFDPSGGRRTVVPLERIPLYLREATIATEDPTFYDNPGFSPRHILRAFWQNLREGGIVSGASTITQQVVKNAFLSPEVTWSRKIKEAILATEVTRRYSKDEILEIYLNQSYYGNMAYGIGTAAEVYFGKPVEKLTLGEATMLAGIPQGPAIYDPYTNLAGAKIRQGIVLDLMVRRGYLSRGQAREVLQEELRFAPQQVEMKAPHFVVYVREQLEAQFGIEFVYRSGLRVYTTLDATLQEAAERIIAERVSELTDLHATNAALVAMDPQNGQILAMVGSADFDNEDIDGQVNVALRMRQPGSSIKPINYTAAFDRGWTASTFIMDITTEFPDGANPPYVPHNHDNKEHGPVLVRDALAQSLNIPAVKTLQFVTVPGMLEMAHRLGIHSLNRPDYGLSLTLGGGDVTLLELTAAYGAFANGGRQLRPTPILRIEDGSGQPVGQVSEWAGQQVLDGRHAYLITSILSDKEARLPTFGPNNILELSRPAAVKTGTTDDYRDAWTIGYTPDLVSGVWVGNADNTPMEQVYGSRGAGPIWHDFMEEALRDRPVLEFDVPEGMETAQICPISGKLHTDKCPLARTELFVAGTAPKEPCDVHVDVQICAASGRRASEFCPQSVVRTQYFESYPPEYRTWAEANGKPQPPADVCHIHTRPPRVEITQPRDGDLVEGLVPIYGSARMDDLSRYEVQYGIGDSPIGWGAIGGQSLTLEGAVLTSWDTRVLRNGLYSLRVVVFDHHGNSAASPAVRVQVANPTPTTTDTPTATPTTTTTETPTPTPSETETPTPTSTPSPTASALPTPTASPTDIQPPTPTETVTPAPTPSPTPTLPPTAIQPTATPSATSQPSPTERPAPTPTAQNRRQHPISRGYNPHPG